MEANKGILIKQGVILFLMGFVGILSSIPLIPQLLALQPEQPPMPMYVIQILSVIQASVFLIGMVLLGSFFSYRVKLNSPIVQGIARSEDAFSNLTNIVRSGVIGGLVGGVCVLAFFGAFSSYLPPEFLESAKIFSPPWYTRILYGGITEEILIRWGLMSFFAWCCFRLTQEKGADIRSYNYVVAIILSALAFGALHLPAAYMLSSTITAPLIVYIILGNAVFGFIAGFLYWRRGLECAIVAHIVAHITMLVGEALA